MEIRHKLKTWEKKWGYLAFNKEDIAKLFCNVENKRFSLFIEGTELIDRKIDRWGRIWIGKEPLRQFEVNDTLVCSRDSRETYHIRKA